MSRRSRKGNRPFCAEARLCGCCAEYQTELTAYTRGRGRIQLRVSGYRPCREQEQIVKELGYDPARDLENPASSVFCAHGAGYEVKWQDVDAAAHLPLLRLGGPARQEPQRIVRSVAPGGAPELEKELLAIFERTYGAIRRRDVLPQMMLRSEDKREFLQSLGPADDFLLVDGYNILFRVGRAEGAGPDEPRRGTARAHEPAVQLSGLPRLHTHSGL